jgi:hypothetical protein
MRDSQFTNLNHRLGAMEMRSRSETLAVGYRPDFTATLAGGLSLIIENMPRTDLRTVIGCYQRADKYCRDSNATPSLVIVTAAKGRVSAIEAAARLREFALFWTGVNPPGAIREVLVLSDRNYAESVRRRIPVLSAEFRELCVTIALGLPVAPAPRRIDRDSLRARGDAVALTA